jgi:hypothetical protein
MSYQVKVGDEVKMTFSDEQQAKDYAKTVAGVVVPLAEKKQDSKPLAEKLEQ